MTMTESEIKEILNIQKAEYKTILNECLVNDGIVDRNEFKYRLEPIHDKICIIENLLAFNARFKNKKDYENKAMIIQELVFEYDRNAKKIYNKLKDTYAEPSTDTIDTKKRFLEYHTLVREYYLSVNKLEELCKFPLAQKHQNVLNELKRRIPIIEKWVPKVSKGVNNKYNITFKGKSYQLSFEDLKNKITNINTLLRKEINFAIDRMTSFNATVRLGGKDGENLATLTTIVSEKLANTKMPTTKIFDKASNILFKANKAYKKGEYVKSVEVLESFDEAFNQAVAVWQKYIDDVIGGGESAVWKLEGIKFLSFTAVSAYVGGAFAGRLILKAGYSAGKAAAVSSGIVAAGESLVDSTATLTGKGIAGDKIDWTKEIGAAFWKAGKKGVTAYLGTYFCKFIFNNFIDKCTSKTVNHFKLNKVADDVLGSEDIYKMYLASAKNYKITTDKLLSKKQLFALTKKCLNNKTEFIHYASAKAIKSLYESFFKAIPKAIINCMEKGYILQKTNDLDVVLEKIWGELTSFKGLSQGISEAFKKELIKSLIKAVIQGAVISE